jgi:hypothetical protein
MSSRAVALALLAGLGAGLQPARAIAPARHAPVCLNLSFSPSFASDGTAMCDRWYADPTTKEPAGVDVYVTRDHGRTWTFHENVPGIVANQNLALGRTFVSPAFSVDHALYITLSIGLYRSTDYGATFSSADPLVGDGGVAPAPLTAYQDAGLAGQTAPALPTGDGGGARAVFVMASPNDANAHTSKYDDPLHEPVVGSPFENLQFVVPSTFARDHQAFVLANVTNVTDAADPAPPRHLQLFACDATLSCPTGLFTFPAGLRLTNSWAAPDYATSRGLVVELTDAQGLRSFLWRSGDGGRTFSPWSSVDHLIAPLGAIAGKFGNLGATASLATDPASPRHQWLLVGRGAFRWVAGMPPVLQLFESTDRGATWRRTGWRLGDGQHGRRGNLPDLTSLVSPARGTLFALSVSPTTGAPTPVYSLDGGRTWHSGTIR